MFFFFFGGGLGDVLICFRFDYFGLIFNFGVFFLGLQFSKWSFFDLLWFFVG